MRKIKPRIRNGPSVSSATRRCWNVITDAGNDTAEITLYGDVCDRQPKDWWTGEDEPGMFITPEGFLEDLALVKGKKNITIKINSGGGDLYTGIAIHNAIKELKGHKTVIVEGIAASAASVIACAGDDVQVYPGSMIMIHEAAMAIVDYVQADDLKKYAKNLEAANSAIAQIYHAKTGLEVDKLRTMMRSETWMVGQDAVDKGFATALISSDGPNITVSADRRVLLVAGIRHDIKAFHNLPKGIPVKTEAPASAASNNLSPIDIGTGGKSMTEKELREQFPDLVASIESAAVEAATESTRKAAIEAEHARLQAIESIEAQIGDKSLIAKAKYGAEACTAEQLAFRAMQAQAKLGGGFLAGLKADGTASHVGDVAGAPNSGNADGDSGDDAASLKGITDAYKKISARK